MSQSQASHFKRYHLLAYVLFWGGEFLVMLLAWLAQSVFKIDLHEMELLMMGPVWIIMFAGAVLLLIGNVHLNLFENKITNLIMGLVSAILQAGVNFVIWLVIWLIFLTEVLGINLC
ncbi:hypothetical protein Pan153_05670 [Gimesia panareensis]|uniref:Uncharacterized protein n=1 Tax=Gimesia panareensis TaxID=2527978 RepID=A0A518FHX2_9PLAN|nr:hypothetical protein [Gimesia panareensis]QDV15948.1 hypothetical protein Pan153_05670 [Gimesia panareensis]